MTENDPKIFVKNSQSHNIDRYEYVREGSEEKATITINSIDESRQKPRHIAVVLTHFVRSEDPRETEYNRSIDGIESLLTAMASEGFNMNDKKLAQAFFTAIDAAANNA